MHFDKGKELVLELSDESVSPAKSSSDAGGSNGSPSIQTIECKPLVSSVVWIADLATIVMATICATLAFHVSVQPQRHAIDVAEFVTALTFCPSLQK